MKNLNIHNLTLKQFVLDDNVSPISPNAIKNLRGFPKIKVDSESLISEQDKLDCLVKGSKDFISSIRTRNKDDS